MEITVKLEEAFFGWPISLLSPNCLVGETLAEIDTVPACCKIISEIIHRRSSKVTDPKPSVVYLCNHAMQIYAGCRTIMMQEGRDEAGSALSNGG